MHGLEVEDQGRHALTDVVVKILRDPAAFIFLEGGELEREQFEPLFGPDLGRDLSGIGGDARRVAIRRDHGFDPDLFPAIAMAFSESDRCARGRDPPDERAAMGALAACRLGRSAAVGIQQVALGVVERDGHRAGVQKGSAVGERGLWNDRIFRLA